MTAIRYPTFDDPFREVKASDCRLSLDEWKHDPHSPYVSGGYYDTITTTGDCPFTLAPVNEPLNYTINFTHSDPNEPKSTTIPKCYECKKDVELMHCHGDERRIDISLKRFKGCKDDALEWFADTFDWMFDEEPKWRNVQPDEKVSTVHADRKIITDWLEKKS
jgi:hypothetical protein